MKIILKRWIYIHQITEKWDIDLSAISNTGKTEKRFDYVIKTDNQIYVIETNCYTSGGSKLNAKLQRSYKQISQEVDTIDGVTFVWFTDGAGWTSARHNLEETFDIMPHIYNINDLENGIIKEVLNKGDIKNAGEDCLSHSYDEQTLKLYLNKGVYGFLMKPVFTETPSSRSKHYAVLADYACSREGHRCILLFKTKNSLWRKNIW